MTPDPLPPLDWAWPDGDTASGTAPHRRACARRLRLEPLPDGGGWTLTARGWQGLVLRHAAEPTARVALALDLPIVFFTSHSRLWSSGSGSRALPDGLSTGATGEGGVAFVARDPARDRGLAVLAADVPDLHRVLDQIARRGLARLVVQVEEHRAMVRGLATRPATPGPALDRAFALDVELAEALLMEVPGGQAPIEPGAGGVTPASYDIAGALLLAGIREPARELLRLADRGVAEAGLRASLAALWEGWVGRKGAGTRPAQGPVTQPAETMTPLPLADCSERSAGDGRVVRAVIEGLWGAAPGANGRGLTLRPAPPADWPGMDLSHVRIGSSVLDLAFRRHRGEARIRVARRVGPTVPVECRVPGATLARIDDEPLSGRRAWFLAAGEHEVAFHAPA